MKIDLSKKWTPYLTRPFDLFGTWLWQRWYDACMEEALGIKWDQVLCVEISKNVVRQYRTKSQLNLLNKSFRYLLFKKPRKLEQLLKHGLSLYKKADVILKKRLGGFKSLDQALDFFNEFVFYTTVFPNFPSIILKPNEKLSAKIEKLCAQLRRVSYYPVFMKKVIIPLSVKHPLVKIQKLHPRKNFVYQKIGKKETIEWLLDPKIILRQLEGKSGNQRIVKGLSIYPGVVCGRVHLVTNFMKPGIMKKGEILISINTNPNLLPLIKKSAAIVADEGGITSHAAIVSREFKIPGVIGTKTATQIFKSGDMVEVDANRGIVRKTRDKLQ